MTFALTLLFWLAFIAGIAALSRYGTQIFVYYYMVVAFDMPEALRDSMPKFPGMF